MWCVTAQQCRMQLSAAHHARRRPTHPCAHPRSQQQQQLLYYMYMPCSCRGVQRRAAAWLASCWLVASIFAPTPNILGHFQAVPRARSRCAKQCIIHLPVCEVMVQMARWRWRGVRSS